MHFGGDDEADDRPTFPDDPSGQHGPLSAQIEMLGRLVARKGSGRELEKLLDALIESFRHHFAAEEQAMERGEYALLEDHRDSHTKFMGHLEALRRESRGRGSRPSAAVVEQLKNWFDDHTQTADADALKFLGYPRRA